MSNTNGKFIDNSKVAPSKWEQFKKKVFPFVKKHRKPIAYISLCLAIAIGSRVQQASVDKQKYEFLLDQRITEVSAEYEEAILQLKQEHCDEITSLRNEYETSTPEEQMKAEAEYIAKMLYGTALKHSERSQRTAVWCVLNRVDTTGFPNTIQGVCQQEYQWIGYSDDNPVLESLYEIAYKELETWYNSYRPVTADYVYMSWSSDNIVLRDTYKTTKATQYWQAG